MFDRKDHARIQALRQLATIDGAKAIAGLTDHNRGVPSCVVGVTRRSTVGHKIEYSMRRCDDNVTIF